MSDQLEITGHVGPRPPRRSIEADFREFHERNLYVYETLRQLARRWLRRHPGRKCGIGMLYEVTRWTIAFERDETEPFRLNNNYRSYYARLLMETEPDLAGIFDTRKLNAPEPFPEAAT